MAKRVTFIILIVVFITVTVSFYGQKKSLPSPDRFSVATSFYVLGDFVKNIGGETVLVNVITPPGIEPHDYEPTPKDLIVIRRSNIFIYNGGGFDNWAEKLTSTIDQGSATPIISLNMSEHLNKQDLLIENETHIPNPHYWLDPVLAVKEVEVMRDFLIEKNPSQETMYRENAQRYIKKLMNLNQEYEVGLRTCKLREIIVSHNAFTYLGSRYTIHTTPIAGISPEDEPSAKKIGEIARMAMKKNIHYIFFETSASPKLAEVIAREAMVETLVLNPIETLTQMELKTGEDYISVMKKNLNNLQKALACI